MLKQTLVIVAFAFFASLEVSAAPAQKPVIGTVTDFVIGEISVGLGDACIFGVMTDDQKSVALITDFDQCADAEVQYDAVVGKRIQVPAGALTLIDDGGTLKLYKELDSTYFYMFGDFDSIYKGISVGN